MEIGHTPNDPPSLLFYFYYFNTKHNKFCNNFQMILNFIKCPSCEFLAFAENLKTVNYVTTQCYVNTQISKALRL